MNSFLLYKLTSGYLSAVEQPSEEVISNLEKYAQNIGIAFQIRDDILDITSTSEEMGKPVGSDAKNGKTTSLSFMSVDEAEAEISNLTNDAIDIIKKYYIDPNGFCSLVQLAKFMGERKK